MPEGRKLESLKPFLDQYLARPERRAGVQKLDDLASFIAWAKRHADPASALFCQATRETPSICVAIDYHEAGAVTGPDDALARWVKFGAVHPMPFDPRWLAWRAVDGKPLGQAEFAAFLEDHALDLCPIADSIDPATGKATSTLPADVAEFLRLTGGRCGTPEEVVALAKGLDVAVDQKVANRIRLQSGEQKIVFEETHTTSTGGETVTVPPIFLVVLPVFNLSPQTYRLPVRLRYRLDGGRVVWLPTLWRADETVDAAVRDAAERARAETSLPLFYGSSPLQAR